MGLTVGRSTNGYQIVEKDRFIQRVCVYVEAVWPGYACAC